MRVLIDYVERVAECRRLAKLYTRPEHWGHFLEMAETWEILLKHQQETSRRQTIALADRFRKVLYLSDIAAEEAAKDNNNESTAPRVPERTPSCASD
jgi:hypothetical protein